MAPVIDAWFVLVVSIAGWINREQDKALQYLMAENRVLKDQLKKRGKPIRFTDKQRHLLATKAKELGRAALKNIDTVVTPETLLRWHRRFIAHKYDGSAKRGAGRPRINEEIEALIVRMAAENRWGYLRIRGALANLGFHVARTTVANVLARHGIEPAPNSLRWNDYLRAIDLRPSPRSFDMSRLVAFTARAHVYFADSRVGALCTAPSSADLEGMVGR